MELHLTSGAGRPVHITTLANGMQLALMGHLEQAERDNGLLTIIEM
jgi:hypothetical protein